MTRTVGILLIGLAVGLCAIGGFWLLSVPHLAIGGKILGAGILFIIAGPLAAFGVLSIVRGRTEQAEQAESEKLRTILDMVKTRGQVNVSDVVIQLHSDLPAVQSMIYRLVGMGVFSGYVNWNEGILYSEEASQLRTMTQCKNCGGQLTLAGKGVIKCPYCGTEYFLAQ